MTATAPLQVVDGGQPAVRPSLLDKRRLDLNELMLYANDPIPWRCDGIAVDGFVTTIAALGGEGKSFLTLALGGAVQLGSTLAGIACRPGRVALFDAENGPRLLARRVGELGIPQKGLAAYDADGLDLANAATVEALSVETRGVALVIFDSLRTLAPRMSENDSDSVAPVMGGLRRIARTTGAAVIVVHHRGRGDASDYRGSSAIRDQTDLMFTLGREPGDPENRHRRYLRCVKCRIDEEPDTRWLSLGRHHGQLTFAEAAPYEQARKAKPKREPLADQALDLLLRAGPTNRADVARALGKDPKNGTVGRALEALEEDGLAARLTDSRWSATRQMAPQPAGTHETPHPNRESKGANPQMAPAGTPECHGATTPIGGGTGTGTLPNVALRQRAEHLLEAHADIAEGTR